MYIYMYMNALLDANHWLARPLHVYVCVCVCVHV